MTLCLAKSLKGNPCTNELGHTTDHECWSHGKLAEHWPNGRPNDVGELFNKWAPVLVHRTQEFGKDVLQVVEIETGIPVTEHAKKAKDDVEKTGRRIVKSILSRTADNIGKGNGKGK